MSFASIARAGVALLLVLLPACGSGRDARRQEGASHVAFVDDFGDTTRLARPATRIVSLNPATTELLFAVGAGPRLVGRTHWDLYPDSARLVPDLGNGIQPNVEAVLAARPDLVLLYAGESNRAAAAAFRRAGIPTIALRVDRIADFHRTMRLLSIVIGDSTRVRSVEDSVTRTLERVRRATASLPRPTIVWPVWEQPLLVVGSSSFLAELLTIAGGRNAFDSLAGPSPQVTMEDVVRRDPDIVLTGPVGVRHLTTDPAWRRLRAVRQARVFVVDTALTLRPGARLGEAAVSIARLLHPGAPL